MDLDKVISQLSAKSGLFISLYLPIDPGETRKEFVSTFHSHLKTLRQTAKNLKHQEEKYLDAIFKKIANYLESVDTRGTKTLAIFAGKDFFETFKLPVSIPVQAHIDIKPLFAPMTKAFSENPPFLLAVIDRDKAKIIEVNLAREEVESKIIKSDVPQRILAKGEGMGKESKILRHIEDHLHRHLIKIVQELERFEQSYPNGLVVLGAQKEYTGKFKMLLPKGLRAAVVGDFGANLDDNETSMIKKAQKIIDEFLERKARHEV